MNYYSLNPEVAGGLGSNTVMNRRTHPPAVRRLHYEFEGWLGDALLESFPCFIVTATLGTAIQRANFTGVAVDEVEISTSETFNELQPQQRLPKFVWLQITGKAGRDDFGLSDQHRLVVSGSALRVLQSFPLDHCDIDLWDSGPVRRQ